MKTVMILLSLPFVAASCALTNLSTCELEINQKFIDSGCSLGNGVYFEKLYVIEKDTAGIPSKYHVTTRFSCHNPGVISNFFPNRIYFDKKNKHYTWGVDSFYIYYERKGRDVRGHRI